MAIAMANLLRCKDEKLLAVARQLVEGYRSLQSLCSCPFRPELVFALTTFFSSLRGVNLHYLLLAMQSKARQIAPAGFGGTGGYLEPVFNDLVEDAQIGLNFGSHCSPDVQPNTRIIAVCGIADYLAKEDEPCLTFSEDSESCYLSINKNLHTLRLSYVTVMARKHR